MFSVPAAVTCDWRPSSHKGGWCGAVWRGVEFAINLPRAGAVL